jgi:hypothetical protein
VADRRRRRSHMAVRPVVPRGQVLAAHAQRQAQKGKPALARPMFSVLFIRRVRFVRRNVLYRTLPASVTGGRKGEQRAREGG